MDLLANGTADGRIVGFASADPQSEPNASYDAASATPADWERVIELCRRDRVVAIGETGLDRYRDKWDR